MQSKFVQRMPALVFKTAKCEVPVGQTEVCSLPGSFNVQQPKPNSKRNTSQFHVHVQELLADFATPRAGWPLSFLSTANQVAVIETNALRYNLWFVFATQTKAVENAGSILWPTANADCHFHFAQIQSPDFENWLFNKTKNSFQTQECHHFALRSAVGSRGTELSFLDWRW